MRAEVPMTRRGDEWLIVGQIENLGSTPKAVKVRILVPFVGPNRGETLVLSQVHNFPFAAKRVKSQSHFGAGGRSYP